MATISFITANYLARALQYNGDPDWMVHDKATTDAASAEHFREVVADVAAAGFDAIDLWTAHCRWDRHADTAYAREVPLIAREKGLKMTSYAGGLHISDPSQVEAPLRFMKELGIPIFAGGIWGVNAIDVMPAVDDACSRLGVKYALENHPEKSVDEILAKIGGGKFKNCGIALDTGWCGTHGIDALDAVRRLREHLLVVHLKDVKRPDAHDTCTLGCGIVNVEGVVKYLKSSGYDGPLCIEHEPYDRDPMPEIKTSLERVKHWLGLSVTTSGSCLGRS